MEKMNLDILKLLFSKRKHILIVTLAAAAIAGIVSMTITPMYKSTAAIFPTNIGKYSEESQTEQLMQFITASEVKDMLLENFNLAKHYELDSTSERFETMYTYMYEENVKISQTRFESIQIEILDKDPVMAQKLVYGLIDAVNKHIRNSLNSKTEEFIAMHKTYTESKKRRMDSLEIVLRGMSKEYGLLDYFTQVSQASRYYYKEVPSGKEGKLGEVMKKLGEKGVLFMSLMEQYKGDMGYYNESRQEMDKGIRDINKKFTYVTIASKPNLPEVKATPKRTMMVAIGGNGGFIFACVFFITIDRYKRLKEQLA
ncbi:MAG TPA: Wzz/FepE/Etk N-terminal domain-containing protein [Bacteroidia bacterium]